MKKTANMLFLNTALFLLVGCAANTEETMHENDGISDASIQEHTETNMEQANTSNSTNLSAETEDNSLPDTHENKKDQDILAEYSSKQIEYARIWLQLGPNQEIDALNILHIPAGTPLNMDDETSASYPEDVIQLSGSRLVDGSVTYSGNGDGTINVYNVPLRWDGEYPAGEDFYITIIENTQLVYVNPETNEKIVALIQLQK